MKIHSPTAPVISSSNNLKRYGLTLASLLACYGCGGLGTSQSQTNPYRSSNFDESGGYSSTNSRKQDNAATSSGINSFVVLGDATNPKRIGQLLKEIGSLNPVPNRVIFVGEQLEESKPESTKVKLEEWSKAIKGSSIASKVKFSVALSGTETSSKEWLDLIKREGFEIGSNGPTNSPPNSDNLASDQSKLSYSLDSNGTRFIFVNTDTPSTEVDADSKKPLSGWVPMKWIESEVRSGQSNAAITSIYVIGNKPMVATAGGGPTVNRESAIKLKEIISGNDKVRAYICGSERLWESTNLGATPSGAVQVSIGNSCNLNSKWTPSGGPYLGFTVFKTMSDGRVTMSNFKSLFTKPDAPVTAAKPEPDTILFAPAPSEKPKSVKSS